MGLIQRVILWTAASILLVLSAYGFITNHLLNQEIWADQGLTRFISLALTFAVAGGFCGLFERNYFRPLFCVAVILTAWSLIGAGALFSCLLCFVAFLSLGDRLLREQDNPLIAIATGASAVIAVFEFVVRIQIHYPFVYLAALFAIIAFDLKRLEHWLAVFRGWILPAESTSTVELGLEVGISFFLYFYLLLACKPEVGADGLVTHMAVPARIALVHKYDLDFRQFSWSLIPLGADWLFTLAYGIGGEFAARLLNLGLLGGVSALVFAIAKQIGATRALASLLCLLWLSTPLVDLVTGSVYSENLVAFLSLSCLASVSQYLLSNRTAYLWATAAICGALLATKFSAITLLIPLIPCALILGYRSKIRIEPKIAAMLVGVVLVIGAPAYLRAWIETGNPFFPFANNVFKSPYFVRDALEHRFHSSVDPVTFFRMTYEGGYLESNKGALGFQYVFLIPLSLLAFRRNWKVPALLNVIVGTLFLFFSIVFMAYSRYLYSGLPMITCGAAALLCDLRVSDRRLYKVFWLACIVCIGLNAYFLPASGWYQKDGFLNPLMQRQEARAYVTAIAPEREIIAYLNDKAPGSRIAFLGPPSTAGLDGTAFIDNWHNLDFANEINGSPDAETLASRMRAHRIAYFIGPPVSEMGPNLPQALRDFVKTKLEAEYTVSDSVLYHWKTTEAQQSTELASDNWTRPGTVMTASPNPIVVTDGSGLGITALSWSTTATTVEIHVSTPDGPIMAMGASKGEVRTEKWVRNGTKFYLQDHSAADPKSPAATLAVLAVSVK